MMEISDPIQQLQDENNLTKYKTAGKIVAIVLEHLISLIKPGINVSELCSIGDIKIIEEVNKVYKNISHKGVAFPTCISINNVAGYYCPIKNNNIIINDKDLVKIELAVHIDGFPALLVYTVYVNESTTNLDDIKKLRVIQAVNDACKEILHNMTPDKSNLDISNILSKYAKKYNCSLPQVDNLNYLDHAPGIMSYEISRNIIDGYIEETDPFVHRFILSRNSEIYDLGMRKTQFEEFEVYAIDVVMCSGDGNLIPVEGKTNIYKRVVERRENLKLKASHETLTLFNNTRFPININNTTNSKIKLGLKECLEKKLIEPYTVLRAKNGDYIARSKFTVVVKSKPILISGKSLDSQINKFNIQ